MDVQPQKGVQIVAFIIIALVTWHVPVRVFSRQP